MWACMGCVRGVVFLVAARPSGNTEDREMIGPGGGFIRRATTVAIAATLMTGVVVGTATAKTVTDYGCAGSTSASDAAGWYTPAEAHVVGVNPLWVRSSPCYSGYQRVSVIYRKWGWNRAQGQWVLTPTLNFNLNLAPGEWKNFGFRQGWTAVYYDVSLDVTVRWRNYYTGDLIGTRYIDYNEVWDYNCPYLSGYRWCEVRADPIVGAKMHFFGL